MKKQNGFWTAVLLMVALGIGGCTLELTQEEGPTTGQNSQEPQEQEAGG
jgi:hypothetical protein